MIAFEFIHLAKASDMQTTMPETTHADRGKLEVLGWGLGFIWIGVAMLLDAGWGWGLLGLGLIGLSGQALRRYRSIEVDWFGLILGMILLLAGIMNLLNLSFPDGAILPVLSILLGTIFLLSFLKKSRNRSTS